MYNNTVFLLDEDGTLSVQYGEFGQGLVDQSNKYKSLFKGIEAYHLGKIKADKEAQQLKAQEMFDKLITPID